MWTPVTFVLFDVFSCFVHFARVCLFVPLLHCKADILHKHVRVQILLFVAIT